jgi:hypothetical protein
MRLLALILLMTALPHAATPNEQSTCPVGPPKHISIKEGEYSPTPGATIRLENFAGQIVPLTQELPECFRNLTLVESGSITLSSESITRLFNSKAGANPKMKDMKIVTEGQRLNITGKVHKLVDINFQIEGPLQPMQHGDVRMNVENIHADGMPLKGLMNFFGSDLAGLMGSGSTPGVTAQNNSLIFHTEQLMHFRGEISAVHILKDGLTLEFGSGKPAVTATKPAPTVKTAHLAHGPAPHHIN